MNKQKAQQEQLLRRQKRIRAKVVGTAQRPRLSVYRGVKHIYASLINDETGVTLCTASDRSKAAQSIKKMKTARAHGIGLELAKVAKAKGITKVVFDRNGRIYHGRVRALAEGAREGGLGF